MPYSIELEPRTSADVQCYLAAAFGNEPKFRGTNYTARPAANVIEISGVPRWTKMEAAYAALAEITEADKTFLDRFTFKVVELRT